MRFWVTLLIAGMLPLAGCLSEDAPAPVDDVVVEPEVEEAPLLVLEGLLLDGPLNGTTPVVGNYTLTADVEDANATWTVTYLFTAAEASEEGEEGEGADGSEGGEGGQSNVTEVTLLEGTGLPALFNATFETPGTYALTAAVQLDGYEAAETGLEVVVAAAEVAEENTPQDPITITGTATGHPEAGDENYHEFELTSTPSRIVISLDQGATALDIDWEVTTPSGAQADRQASFECLSTCQENDLVVDNAAHLGERGVWTIMVDPYAAAAASYTITVTFEY